ncbi:hypothetical protein [Halobellus rufus]|uniref:hypothetical protein n=1 Tax=Halobellus rufus TaxID=1448860 RepID=UPI00373FD9E6
MLPVLQKSLDGLPGFTLGLEFLGLSCELRDGLPRDGLQANEVLGIDIEGNVLSGSFSLPFCVSQLSLEIAFPALRRIEVIAKLFQMVDTACREAFFRKISLIEPVLSVRFRFLGLVFFVGPLVDVIFEGSNTLDFVPVDLVYDIGELVEPRFSLLQLVSRLCVVDRLLEQFGAFLCATRCLQFTT